MKFANEKEYQDFIKNKHVKEHGAKSLLAPPPLAPEQTLPMKVGRTPNKTETAAYHYLKMCYPNAVIRYEAVTFHLEQKAAYTPDYLVTLGDDMICYEIKNAGYKHASYGRSRLAFRQAALEFPQFQFIWLELQKGEWVLN